MAADIAQIDRRFLRFGSLLINTLRTTQKKCLHRPSGIKPIYRAIIASTDCGSLSAEQTCNRSSAPVPRPRSCQRDSDATNC